MGLEVLLAAALTCSSIQGGVSISPREVDFGEVMQNEPRSATILVQNHTSTAVSLTERSAACARLTWGTLPIEPGSAARLVLALPAEGRVGYFAREVVFSVAPTGQTVSVRLVGTIVPGLRVSPQVVRLRARPYGALAERRVEVRAGKPFRIRAAHSSDPRIAVAWHGPQAEAWRHGIAVGITEEPTSAFSAELILEVAVEEGRLELRVPVRVWLQ